MIKIKLKGGALYVSVIISILISIILSLFIVVAYYNTQSVQAQNSYCQLQLSLESGFELAQSNYYNPNQPDVWQKMSYNNDSVKLRKVIWGCFTLVNVTAKNAHFLLQKTGLFGVYSSPDTAMVIAEQNRPVGLAGKIKVNGLCYFPSSGIKSVYINGKTFSDLNSIKPYIKSAPLYIPQINESYLKTINQCQSEINPYIDSFISFIPTHLDQSFLKKTAVIQKHSIILNSQKLSNNIKIIASDIIKVRNTCDLNSVLLIARKVIFEKGFKGTVHVIAKDSIITEDECTFNYPSSFCVNSNNVSKVSKKSTRGIFFGSQCKFKGGILAVNDKKKLSQMMIRLGEQFELIGNVYSSDYMHAQGNLYGTLYCQTLLLQTPSNVYENYLQDCRIDSKKYSQYLSVPNWFNQTEKKFTCAKWL